MDEFRKHWQCLDDNNHQLWQCRKPEWKLSKCVYDNLVSAPSLHRPYTSRLFSTLLTLTSRHEQKLEKTIPDTPKNQVPVHLRTRQIYAHERIMRDPGQPPYGKSVDPPSVQAQAQAQAS